MSDLINKYPYTDLHSVNLDYILKVVRENAGLHLEVSGNQLLMKTADNTIISAITIPYATEAGSANTAVSAGYASSAGTAANATYAATAGTATSATTASNATHATSADTAGSASTADTATNATYAVTAGSATTAGTATNALSADYATTTGTCEHATYAIESVATNGNYLRFTTAGGQTSDLMPLYAYKASYDGNNNPIRQAYVSSVELVNGALVFKGNSGNVINTINITSSTAEEDSYGNLIANFIKSITVADNSNYVTIEHGTGTVETIIIPYSDTAWKDTNGNVIKNTYVKRLEIITDSNDGQKKLVAYNGDNPEAELFRIPVEAYRAQVADNATHANNADYATNAGTANSADYATTAGSAATSTGSISSIDTPSDEYDSFTINNGDGTTKKIDIHNKSIIEINLYGDGIKTDPIDLAVNASEDYEVDSDDLSKYRYISDVSDVITPNINFIYVTQSGGIELFNAISQKTTINGGTAIILSVFNGTSFIILQIVASNTPGYITITRLM